MQKEILLIALFTCHWLADFTSLSTATMLSAKRFGTPLYPIFNHACCHGLLMSMPIIIAAPKIALFLISFQVVTHFIIDVGKGKITYYFPSTRDNTKYPYWILFGFDQLLHAIVIIFIAYFSIEK